MKSLLLCLLLAFSTTAFSDVIKRENEKKSCTEYVIINKIKGNLPRLLKDGESIHNPRDLYGYKLEDLEVNFDEGYASFKVTMQIILGLNRPLLSERVKVSANSPQFKEVINMINKKLSTYESICLDAENSLISAE